ncbi:hypothetical protein SNK03_006822 [Fusarium graminearum]
MLQLGCDFLKLPYQDTSSTTTPPFHLNPKNKHHDPQSNPQPSLSPTRCGVTKTICTNNNTMAGVLPARFFFMTSYFRLPPERKKRFFGGYFRTSTYLQRGFG